MARKAVICSLGLLLLIQGCAATQSAILDTPKRLNDALIKDPVRRTHVLSRVLEGSLGGATTAGILIATGPYLMLPAALAGVLMEFIYYEYIAEPAGWTGYYFERGPRDDEEFIYP